MIFKRYFKKKRLLDRLTHEEQWMLRFFKYWGGYVNPNLYLEYLDATDEWNKERLRKLLKGNSEFMLKYIREYRTICRAIDRIKNL